MSVSYTHLGKTIEKELYSEDKVMEAMQRIAAGNNAEISYAGDNDDDGWGDVSSFTDEEMCIRDRNGSVPNPVGVQSIFS